MPYHPAFIWERLSLLRYKRIFLGNQCSNNCLHCPYKSEEHSQPDLASITASLAPDNKDGIELAGGEPTLRKDLIEIIHEARKYGYRRIKLMTNGRSLSDIHFIENLLNAGGQLFDIKLWGSHQSLHDQLTRSSGSFFDTIRGLENMLSLPQEKFTCVRIQVCQENYGDLENIVAMALSFGINRIIIAIVDTKLEIRTVLPHVHNAVNISILNRIWILTEGLPFCIMRGLEHHIGEIYTGWRDTGSSDIRHQDFCIECLYNELCPGMADTYINNFGGREFSPVKDHSYVKKIRALHG